VASTIHQSTEGLNAFADVASTVRQSLLRGFACLGGGGGGGGGLGRAPTATRALSSSSGSRGDGGGGGSSSPNDKLAARGQMKSTQGEDVGGRGVTGGEVADGGAVLEGRGGYGASTRGSGGGGGGGRGGGGAGVKRKVPFAESLQLNGELTQAGSVEEVLRLVEERAEVFNPVNVSTALNKLWKLAKSGKDWDGAWCADARYSQLVDLVGSHCRRFEVGAYIRPLSAQPEPFRH